MTIPTDGRIDLDALAELAKRLRKTAERCKEAADGETLVGRDTARMAQYRLDEAADAIDLARRAAIPSEQGEAAGEAGTMPGTDGFTMAVFRAADVPLGTKLYTHPAPAAGVKVKALTSIKETP